MNTPYFNNFMPQPGQFGMPQMQAPTQQMNQIQFVNGIESAKRRQNSRNGFQR